MNKTKELLESVEAHTEWLETTTGEEIYCISIENLEMVLKKYFNE